MKQVKTNLTQNEAQAVLETVFEDLNIESYEDASNACVLLAHWIEAIHVIGDPNDRDEVEQSNLYHLHDLLMTCGDMFRECDPYFR